MNRRTQLIPRNTVVAAVSIASLAVAQTGVPSPEQAFGFRLGDDRKLADWTQLVSYYRDLAEVGPDPFSRGRKKDGRPALRCPGDIKSAEPGTSRGISAQQEKLAMTRGYRIGLIRSHGKVAHGACATLLATIGMFTKGQIGNIANLSRWAFLLTFAGVGLQTNIRELRSQGLRPLVAGAVGEFAIAGTTLVLVVIASRGLGLV